MQWKNEIEAFTDGIKVAVWHGAAREGKISELKKFNVVSGDFYPWITRRVYSHNYVPGLDYIRCVGKRIPKATEWLQTQRQNH